MDKLKSYIRIVGIDPGLQKTGWGVIDVFQSHWEYVAHGVVSTKSIEDMSCRLGAIFLGLRAVFDQWDPDQAAIEETFVNTNPTSALKLGQARGVAMVAPALFNVKLYEYSANKVKKSVTGAGHADKSQISFMITKILRNCPGVVGDAADALAVAACHAAHSRF